MYNRTWMTSSLNSLLYKMNMRSREGQGPAQSHCGVRWQFQPLVLFLTYCIRGDPLPLLGFEQRPVTFCSYGRPLVVKLLLSALSARPACTLRIGLAKRRRPWTPRIWRLIFQFLLMLDSQVSVRAGAEKPRSRFKSVCHLEAERPWTGCSTHL